MAIFTMTANAYTNLPPSQVGDNAKSTNYGVSYTFTVGDFTDGTTPAYSDPEGDTPAQLKILTIPSTGAVELSGTPVTPNQIIPFYPDISSGLLKYDPDNGTTTEYDDPFTFEVSDSGSGQFVG